MSNDQITLGPKQRIGFTNSACIHCGIKVDVFRAASDPGKEAGAPEPEIGDISMCIRCGELQAINDAGDGFRKLTDEEMAKADASDQIKRLREAQKVAAANGGAKRIEIMKRDEVAASLANYLHNECIRFYRLDEPGGAGKFTADQVLDVASAGMTLASCYLRDLPFDQRLRIVSGFIRQLTDQAFGSNPVPMDRRMRPPAR